MNGNDKNNNIHRERLDSTIYCYYLKNEKHASI